VPPGARTRAHSRPATSESNQCQACATTTASTLCASSGITSAEPVKARVDGLVSLIMARIALSGSTAIVS